MIVHNKKQLHLTTCMRPNPTYNCGKKYINIENFICDVKQAMDKYFDDLERCQTLQNSAKIRVDCMSILEIYEPEESDGTDFCLYSTTASVTSSSLTTPKPKGPRNPKTRL